MFSLLANLWVVGGLQDLAGFGRIWLSDLVFWNFSQPELIPKGNTLKQNRAHGVMNVFKGLDSQANLIC